MFLFVCFLSFQDDGDYGKYGEDDYSEDESQGSHVSDSDFDGGASDLDPGGSDLDPEDRDDRGKINDYEEEITSEEGKNQKNWDKCCNCPKI